MDHFQQWVYENPYVSLKDRHAKWLELETIYLPDRDYDDLDFPKSGAIWQSQLHIYLYPFYYIDYVIAQLCAFQFLKKFSNNQSESWADYLKLCSAGGSVSFNELLKIGDLQSPFEESTFDAILKTLTSQLDQFSNY